MTGLVDPRRLELPASCVSSKRSNQLSYGSPNFLQTSPVNWTRFEKTAFDSTPPLPCQLIEHASRRVRARLTRSFFAKRISRSLGVSLLFCSNRAITASAILSLSALPARAATFCTTEAAGWTTKIAFVAFFGILFWARARSAPVSERKRGRTKSGLAGQIEIRRNV
jgi:hypothetical protein